MRQEGLPISGAPPKLGVGQAFHFCCLAGLLALVGMSWRHVGSPNPTSFWIAVAFPVAHQIFVWLTWRLELSSAAVSRRIGFHGYLGAFFVLFGDRFVSILILAWLDRGSLKLEFVPRYSLTLLLALPAAYAMFSVARYFGMVRAAGADHFEPRYRALPLVREGIFRFTSNGMYFYAFLAFWAIALGFDSSAGLMVAAFSHLYIWVHFHATEKPDMEFLYSST